jgi:hypothetical protein
MYNELMKVQKQINEGFQEQMTNITVLLKIQMEVNERLEARVTELENALKKLQEEA